MARTKRGKLSHEIAAEIEPLQVGASNYKTHALTRVGEELVVLKPSGGHWLFAFIFMVLGGGMTLAAGYSLSFPGDSRLVGWILGGCGLAFLLVGLAIPLASSRWEFDVREGTARQRRFVGLRQRSWPLDQVLAVQLVEGGWHGQSDSEGSPYFTYQMNLVLNDESQPRINLTNHANWNATWTVASELAEFLKVPLLDEVTKDE